MTPTNLDLTLLNIVPTKTVLRKKHRPDDEALNSQPGDEAEPQWAASDTQSEANAIAIGGESYQLAQATIPASGASGASAATAAAPVIESSLISNLLLAGAVLGGAAVVADRAKSSTASTPAPAGDTTAPTITTVAITGASGVQNSSLNAGDVLSITVTLSEATTVTTTGGTPQLALNIGGTIVQANYASGSGSTALVFSYTVLAGQTDANGISIGANSLSLNGGTLKDAAGNAATLNHALVADNAAYLVDTTAPTLAISSNVAAVKAGDTATVSFTFSEAPTGFAASDVNTTGGTLSAPVVSTTDPKVYTAIFTPTTDTAANASITVAAASYSDAAGNGGAAASTPTIAIDTTIHNIVNGTVTAGPVIIGSGLTVNLYKADGTTLLGSGGLNGAGQFHIDVGSYTGAVIAKVVDANDGLDYMDEATGLGKDLNANLMAVSVVTGGTITLNINPVTTIAAIKAGLAADGSGSVNATSVADANTAVAAAFGLGNITITVPVTTIGFLGPNSNYNPDDGLNAGEKYGAVLASLSGADKNNGGNTQTTINTLVAAISGTGATATLTTAGQNELVNGATTADANTEGNLTGIFDTRPLVSISAAGDTVKNEGSTLSFNQTYSFTVTRSHGNGASTVDYAVDGVADAVGRVGATASDFGLGSSPLLPHGTVSFASGETSKTITVSVAGDQVTERDENFSVTLLSPTNATLGTSTSVQATIVNDDHATLPAAQIFTAQGVSSTLANTAGYIRVMADFSKAAYDLQTWETSTAGGRAINDKSPLADKALDAVLAEGWEPLTLNPTLAPSSLAAPNSDLILNPGLFTVVNRMDNGYYTNGNAAALVARSTDSLVISFRGTNDNSASDPFTNPADQSNVFHPDADQWGKPFDGVYGNMNEHYDLFSPLIAAIKAYIATPGANINHIYVTGHSLGGAMAIKLLNEMASDARYKGVTFAAPAFTLSTDGLQQIFFDNSSLIQIEIDKDPVPQATWLATTNRPGQVLTFAGNGTGDTPDMLGNFNVDNHTMDYYRQITQSVDPDSWQKIVAQPGDQSIAIGAASGPAYFTPIADRTSSQYDTSFLVDGRITQAVVDGLINSPHSNTALANDTLTSGFRNLNDHGIYYGGQGNDILTGDATDELFLGGSGNDTIRGGGGRDSLEGGTGADNFIFDKYDAPIVTFNASTGNYTFGGGKADVITSGSFNSPGLQGDRITLAAPTLSSNLSFTQMATPSNGQVGDDQYFLEHGTFFNGTGEFTRNSSGFDTLVVYDTYDAISIGQGAFVIQGVIPGNLSTTQLPTGESVIYFNPDTTAPTLTITDNTIATATGPVVYGFNFSEPVTGFTADDVVTAGVKAQLIQTDATHYTMTVIPPTGSGTMFVGVNAGAVTDLAGNPNALAISDPQAYAPAPATGPYVLGQAVIDLGTYGTLIAPVQVEGRWYYFWDRSGDSPSANTGSLNGGVDYTTHDVLDGIFIHDINGVTNTTGQQGYNAYGTTDSYRYSTLNGVQLALPTNNVNDLLDVWGAYNGAPTGWQASPYWSASSAGSYGHALFDVTFGLVLIYPDYANGYVALQVLPPDTTAPTFTSPATATLAENTPSSITVYDATADGDVGVTYSLTGADAALFNIAAATGLVTFKASPNFEAPTDAGANNIYDFTVTATDAASNATAKAVQLTVTDVAEGTSLAGQAVIDLGSYGKLIAPVQVEGNWYYFWDRSGDGTSASTGSLNGGVDYTTHNVLDSLFNLDINRVPNATVQNADGSYGTTDSYRYATLNGVNLALPTTGGQSSLPYGANGVINYQPGTVVSSGASTNPTYNDLLAVWDAYNGSGTGLYGAGTPTGWPAYVYWSATPSIAGHAYVGLNIGAVFDSGDNGYGVYVALQVL